jgi:outer membrane protein OmpA-like peptidoglycan-associated protein
MAMITPFAMGVCQEKIAEGQRNAVAGTVFLCAQETSLISALPLSILHLLGWSGKAHSPNAADAANVSKNTKWAWLFLGVVGFAGLYYLKNQSVTPTPPKIEALPIELPKPDTTAQMKVIALSDSVKIATKAGSFLDSLYQELSNKASSVGKHLNFDNVNFATNSAVVPKDYQTKLDDIAKVLKAFPKVELLIEGHTDNVGNAAQNLKLSDARATAVRAYLVSHGIEAARLVTKGFGATKPTADNATEEGRAKNRRIEAVITKE